MKFKPGKIPACMAEVSGKLQTLAEQILTTDNLQREGKLVLLKDVMTIRLTRLQVMYPYPKSLRNTN